VLALETYAAQTDFYLLHLVIKTSKKEKPIYSFQSRYFK